MNIEQIELGSKGTFLIKDNNQPLAQMTYSKAPEFNDRDVLIK